MRFMKIVNKLLLSILFIAAFVACNGYEDYSLVDYGHLLDGEFTGERLIFTIDGEPHNVKSVTVNSWLADTEFLEKDSTMFARPTIQTYSSNITIKGFPGKKDRLTIHAITHEMDLKGYTRVNGKNYNCYGKFLMIAPGRPYDEQGLELKLVSE